MSTTALAKLGRNGHANTEILTRICEALDCRPGDILDYVEDDTPECSGL